MSTASRTHDAVKTLDHLRSHLASHDKPIAFLLGAGASCSVRVPAPNQPNETVPLIPAVSELTARCKHAVDELGSTYTTAWDTIRARCKDAGEDTRIEGILTRIHAMLTAMVDAHQLAGLTRGDLLSLDKTLRSRIAACVTPDLTPLTSDSPHHQFARWLIRSARRMPVEIFTLNYDVLIEEGLEAERVPYFDGFVGAYRPFFFPASMRHPTAHPGASWLRLWKMHGSVTWSRIGAGPRRRIVRGEPNPSGELIYPSLHKYEQSRQQPYVAFSDRLTRFLEQRDALLLVLGYSFGDDHINDLIFATLKSHSHTHVYAIQFEDPSADSDLAKRACRYPNLVLIGRDYGIIGSHKGAWRISDPPPAMRQLLEVTDIESADSVGDAAITVGKVRLGEFAMFCAYLTSMIRSSP